MSPSTYAQRIAGNYRSNLAPWPRGFVLGEAHALGLDEAEVVAGLKALHRFVGRLYETVGPSPDAFHLADAPDVEPREGRAYDAARLSFERLPRVLFAIGCMGRATKEGDSWRLVTPQGDLRDYCKRARVTRYEEVLAALAAAGMINEVAEDEVVSRFAKGPGAALGLSVFASAAAPLTKDQRHPPDAFRRADMRVVQEGAVPGKEPPVSLADVTQPLAEVQAKALRGLAECVEGLGYRPELKCSGLARGEWRGNYTSRRLGKGLLGFVVEEGEVRVRLVFDTTEDIAPAASRLPRHLRDGFVAAGRCGDCGKCEAGPMVLALKGAEHRMCRFFTYHVGTVAAADVAPLQALAAAQDAILRAKARR